MRHLEDSYYPLLWAFDRLGAHLFGDTWNGDEYQRSRIDSPDEVEARRAPLENRLSDINRRAEECRASISRSLDEKEIADYRSEIDSLTDERAEINQALAHIPNVDDWLRRQYAAFERARRTEETLTGAFAADDLRAAFVGGLVIDHRLWETRDGFHYYLAESLGVVSQRHSSRRRAMIVVRRDEFHDWLKGIVPIVVSGQSHSPEMLLRARIRQDAKDGTKPSSKTAYRDWAQQEFSGLSRRAFDRIWGLEAPEFWKRAGRPRKP